MWQLYTLGAIAAEAIETIFDKAAIVRNVRIDSLVASFWRAFLFTVCTALIGVIGIAGPLHPFFHWSLILMALIGSCTSLTYTYVLKRVEITNISSIAYLAPVLLLFIDTNIAGTHLEQNQIIGVLLLVLGGIMFTLDMKTFRFKKELSWVVWLIFLFNLAYGAAEAYLFKHLNSAYGVDGVSFFSSFWLLSSIYILILVIVKGKLPLVFARSNRVFIAQTSVGKSFDAITTILWAQALTLAAVSQVSSFSSIYPLMLLIFVLLIQGALRIPLGERVDRSRLGWKVVATGFLVLGGFLTA
ncbi:MAG: hypothetical protein JWL75_438 [Parcubacteria group bacterium]|nr:hypothetical protein [Parcubacteria group bacterium]